MKLYLIRHGETDNNRENKFNGINPQPLNEVGLYQAEKAINTIANLYLDIIICSPTMRTIQTANIINVNNISMMFDERIMERDAGKYTNTLIENIDESEWWNYYTKEEFPTSETTKELCERASDFLSELEKRYHNKNILLVTHGGFTKAVRVYFEGLPEDGNLNNIHTQNCEVIDFSQWIK